MFKLRELERKDITEINKWRNDKELIDCLGAPFRYINQDVDEKWYDSYMNNRNTAVRCSIVDDSDNLLGLISLTGIDYIHRSATLHIMIGCKENRGKGIGFFAVKEILNHAFNRLNLNRIELGVLGSNVVAQKLYKKCGFVVEGTKRQAVYKNGDYTDLVCMSILKEEFLL